MALSRLPDPSRPESVDFDTRRRGFDQMQVRAYLKVLAHELTRLREREADLLAAMAGVDETPRPEPVEFDEQRAMVLLGEETTRVLGAARSDRKSVV